MKQSFNKLSILITGSAITTDNAELDDRICVLRYFGSRVKYINDLQGYKIQLNPIHAAVRRVKLKCLDEWNVRLGSLTQQYLQGLQAADLVLPLLVKQVWHLFVICAEHRDVSQKHLEQNEVGSLIHYLVLPHLQQAYAHADCSLGTFQLAEDMVDEVLSLQMGPNLSSEDVDEVFKVIRNTTDE